MASEPSTNHFHVDVLLCADRHDKGTKCDMSTVWHNYDILKQSFCSNNIAYAFSWEEMESQRQEKCKWSNQGLTLTMFWSDKATWRHSFSISLNSMDAKLYANVKRHQLPTTSGTADSDQLWDRLFNFKIMQIPISREHDGPYNYNIGGYDFNM